MPDNTMECIKSNRLNAPDAIVNSCNKIDDSIGDGNKGPNAAAIPKKGRK